MADAPGVNTPAHVVLNLLVIGRGRGQPWVPILAGALIPDLPILVMYAVERGLLGTAETLIWQDRYFASGWQLFIDAFNSLPLIALGWLLAYWHGSRFLQPLFLSMGLHAGADFLVHNEDAHRHFLPITGWRFSSPVSYWDPRHFGQVFLGAEMLLIVLSSGHFIRRGQDRAVRFLGSGILAATALFIAFALVFWRRLGEG
ncbi:MAG: hypothetical protein JRH01_05765 [Deltaproteobacteria bacterium]|nr:hypothetical protein [Deltaproteobacteria bacterium]MBW2394689.1 hypothetical protein [Deltaproteobacteria bacterium]